MISAYNNVWRYALCLWPLAFIFSLGQILMLLNGNAAELGITITLSIIDNIIFLLLFSIAAWWVYQPLHDCLSQANASPSKPPSNTTANEAHIESLFAQFPWRALKGYSIAGWVFAIYLLIVIPVLAITGDHHFSWRMFVTLALNFFFASGVLAPTLAVTHSIVYSSKIRLKMSHHGLFQGSLTEHPPHKHITSSTHRPWLIFLATGLIPTLILALYIWLANNGNAQDASFILSQAIVLLVMSIAASIILVWHITKTLKTITTSLETGLNQLADGQFDSRVPVLLDDDFGELARGLNTAMQGLQEREDLKNSLALAAEIQQGLLPKDEPDIPFYALKGFQETCYAVGGDYYDYIKLEDGRVWFVIADVSGKGYPAALTMANLQAMLRGLSTVNSPIEEAAAYLNKALCDTLTAGRFVTLFMAKLQPESHSMVWINAGHVPPLLLRASTAGEHHIETLEASSPPLGLIKNMQYDIARTEFQPGDTLLAYTDGVTETSSHQGKAMFGENRLRTWLSEHADTAVGSLPSILLQDLNHFGRSDQDDDLTLLCVKREK